MKDRSPGRRLRSCVWAGLVLAALCPSWLSLAPAFAQDEAGEGASAGSPRQRVRAVLAALPRDSAVLVNVSRADLPASPDILNLGRKSTPALTRCVADNVDDGVRAVCARLLGSLGDRRALTSLQEALAAWAPEVRAAALSALERMPDPSSYPGLVAVLGREDETYENRTAALGVLGLLSDARAVTLLRKTLRDPAKEQFRGAAFGGIWSSRHLFARQTLVDDVKFTLQNSTADWVLAAEYAAAELREPALVGSLVPLMNNADSRVRNRAVYALGRIGDKAASAALLAQIPKVREARMLNNIAFALERLDPKAFFVAIQALAQHKQASIRMNAAFVLGDVRRSEGVPLLARALSDQNDYVRENAVAALGKLDAPEAMPLVEPYTRDSNRALRRTALFSLLALSNGQKKDLVYQTLVAAPPGDAFTETTRHQAILALARLGDARVLGPVLELLERRFYGTSEVEGFLSAQRASSVGGRLLLAWANGRSDLTELVGALRPTGAGLLAHSAIQASLGFEAWGRVKSAIDLSGMVAEPQAQGVLTELLRHPDTSLRYHAAVALSRLGRAEADATVFGELDNLPASSLPEFVRVLAGVDDAKVRERWQPLLAAREQGSERALALAASSVRLAWQPEVAIFSLLTALASKLGEEREIAAFYLQRDRRPVLTSLLRRALSREGRPFVRDRLRKLLDARQSSAGMSS